MEKVLVTGGNGLVGSHIIRNLCQLDYKVVVISRKDCKVDFLKEQKNNIQWICHDLSEPLDMDDTFDVVIHSAASVEQPNRDFRIYKRDNIDATANLIDFSKRAGVRRFVYVSAMRVYGTIRRDCVDEETEIINPVGYGLSKYVGEQMVKEQTGMETISLRLPAVVGKRMHVTWLARTIEKFRRDEDVTYHSPDFVSNNFLDVEDFAGFVSQLLDRKWIYDTLVFGTKDSITIRSCLDLIREYTHSNSREVLISPSIPPFTIDIGRALSMGYQSKSPEEMLRKYFMERA